MISVGAIYDGENLHFFDKFPFDKNKPRLVIVTFMDKIEKEISEYRIKDSVKIDDTEISNYEIQQLLREGKAFEFLANEEEDIYSDDDLKIKY